MVLQSMSWFSGFFRAGYLLNRLATNARLSLGFPRTTSGGITNCRQPSRSAWSSISSALFKSSFAWRDRLRRGSVLKKKGPILTPNKDGFDCQCVSAAFWPSVQTCRWLLLGFPPRLPLAPLGSGGCSKPWSPKAKEFGKGELSFGWDKIILIISFKFNSVKFSTQI